MLLYLMDVVERSCMPVVSVLHTEWLSDMIEVFLQKFQDEFPDASLTPKMHYLVHYPELLREFGPLINCWTLRFEGKHCYFKDVAYRLKNKRNVCKTLATRHEYYQSMFRALPKFLEWEITDISGGGLIPISSLPREVQDLVCSIPSITHMIYQAKKINIGRTTFSFGSAVLVNDPEKESPFQFALMQSFFLVGNDVYILCNCCTVSDYFTHVHAFCIIESGRLCLLQMKDLANFHPLGAYETHSGKLVILKYHLGFC